MRQLTHGDLTAAARAILPLRPQDRDAAVARMLYEAQAADAYRRHIGRAHFEWGNGSLEGAARRGLMPAEPFLSDPDYLDCIARVVAALRKRGGAAAMKLSCPPQCGYVSPCQGGAEQGNG